MAGVSPKQFEPEVDSEDLDSQEMENDSLGEETPSDSTGLDEDDETLPRQNRQQPSNPAGLPNRK